MNRRAIAILAVFAIALSGTGIASLAVLTDTVTTDINASITTIDLTVNGTKSATINLAAGAIPGDLRFAAVVFHNAGTGYVQLPSGANVTAGNGSQFAADSAYKAYRGVNPAQCGAGNGLDATGATALTVAPWTGNDQIDAGATVNYCFVYRLGTTNAVYNDGVSAFTHHFAFPAFYP
jgi:hypothetical protein